ncbi:MAG: helix-turn-helix transcriptional regulator [Patescibacteria group bacterium]
MSSIHSKEYSDLVDRLTKARKDAGLTQVQVSKLLEKPQSYISKIETCQRRIDVLEIKVLAKIYKVGVAEII